MSNEDGKLSVDKLSADGESQQTSAARCKNIYRFIRYRLGEEISDREIARQWGMDWSGFSKLKSGARRLPRIEELDKLAGLLAVPSQVVFEVALGAPAEDANQQLNSNQGADDRQCAWLLQQRDGDKPLLQQRPCIDGMYDLSGSPLREAVFLFSREAVILGYYEGHFSPYVSPQTFLGRRVDEVLPGTVAARVAGEIELAASSDQVRSLRYALPGPAAQQQFLARLIPLEGDLVLGIARQLSEPCEQD